ncbi:hypothetical protein CPT_MarsHill_199 [Staphylococcus phage MarsHill]|nr:hypothetical protein CPT_MarsHill_199 [Staphylococcus phage MarsHill]
MSIKLNNELYYNLRDKTRLSKVENTQDLVTGSFYTFYNDLLLEIRYDNKIYVYTGYSTQGDHVLELSFLKEELDNDAIEDVFMYDNILVIISEKGYYRCFMDQLTENVNNPSAEVVYSYNFYRSSEELNYRPYSLLDDMICIKEANDTLVIRSIKTDAYTKTIVFNKNIEGFSFLYENGLAISFYGEPYHIHVYDFKEEKYTQNFTINENINQYEYDIQHQITRIFKFKNSLYYATRSGRIYRSDIKDKLISSMSYRFYQSGSSIDYIKSYGNYITFSNRSNNILIYNTEYDRKEILKNDYLVKSLAISNFIMVVSLYDSIDEDYKKRIIESGVIPEDINLNPVEKYVMYNPPSIEVLKEKLEYRFDNPEDPLVYINLNIKLAENKLNNFDRSQYRVKLNISHSDNSNVVEESDVKIYKQQGTVKNMYIKIGRKSKWVDNNKLLSLLENGELLYRFTIDNMDNYVTFYNINYPNIGSDFYRHLTGTEVFPDRSPEKSHYDALSEELNIKDIFNGAEDEKVISLLSNLVNEKVVYPSSNLRIDSEDMYLDYPDYDPRRYIDLSNEYPDGQLDTNVINSDVYFNGLKLFKNDLLQKDNFDGSVNVYLNHLAMKKYMNDKNYEYTIHDRKLSKHDNFIISNKSRSLYQTEKLMFKHTVNNDYENQTSLLPTKGILLPNTRVNQFKIQNIRVYVKVYNTNENGNEYYHRLNPRNFNLWIDKEYNMLRVAVYGIQIPEGSTLMIMDNGLTNNVILYDKLNYIKRDIDSLPIVEVGPQGELLTELSRRTEDVEVIVDGLTLIPGRDFHVMNTPNDTDIPSLVAFRNVIPNTAKVEITLLNENSSDVYYFKRPAVDTTNVFVLPDDKRIFTNNIYQNDPYKDINLLKDSDEDVITNENVVKEYELLEPLEKNVDYTLTLRGQLPIDIDHLNITSNGTTKSIAEIQSSSYDEDTKTYQVKFKLEDLGEGYNTGLVIRKTQESSRDVKIDWIKLKKESHSTRTWESFSQGPEFKNKALNFEVFVNNKKIPNNYVTVLNSKAIKISEISGYALNNVMIRFNFSYDEMLQRIIDNYKYKNIDVNEDRYHDNSIADVKSPFDVLTSNRQAKTLGSLLVIQLVNNGKNILDCNVDDLPIDINLNTDIIENSYIRKNINLDMNRTNLIKTINKISDYVNEILDVNKNNENLLLNSNNPSFYVHDNNRNLVLESDEYVSSREYLLGRYQMSEEWEIGEKYYVTIKGKINDGNRFGVWNDKAANNFAFLKYDSELDLFRGSGTINSVWKNDGFKTLSVYNYDRNNAEYSEIEWIKVEKNGFSEYSKAPEDKVISQYPYSKIDEYNKDFYNKESIKDVHIKDNDIHLDFKVDESLLERNKKYTFSFYARNKSKEDVYFINEDLDMNFLIKKDEFKAYVDYIFIDEDVNVNDLLSRSKFIQESDEKDIHLDLFGFKLEKGLNKTEYLPNINDIEGGDLLSNIFNIDSKDNSNLLNLNDDFKINIEKTLNNTSGNNIIKNSNMIIKHHNLKPGENAIDYTENLDLENRNFDITTPIVGNTDYTLSFDLDVKNPTPASQNRIGIEIKVKNTDGTSNFYNSFYWITSGKDFKGRFSNTFRTNNKKIQEIGFIKVYPSLVNSDYIEIKNFQLEEGTVATEWGLTYNELKEKYSREISDKLKENDYYSKNDIIDYNFNNFVNTDYQNVTNTHEIFEETGMDIWSYRLDKKGTPPIYSYRDINGVSSSIIFKPGESKTISVYIKNSKPVPISGKMIWYNYNAEEGELKELNNVMGDPNSTDWQRISLTYRNDSDKNISLSPLFYGTRNIDEELYFTSFQLESNEEMTSYEKPSNVKKKERIQEIISNIKLSNIEDYIDFNSIDTYNLDNDEFYTLSMDVKVEEINDLTTKSLYSGFIDIDGNYTSAKNVYYLPLDNNKINKTFRAYFIYYLRDIENIKSFVVRAGYSKEQSSKNDMMFSKFKLEKGKIATPYSKAINTVENIIIDPEI